MLRLSHVLPLMKVMLKSGIDRTLRMFFTIMFTFQFSYTDDNTTLGTPHMIREIARRSDP